MGLGGWLLQAQARRPHVALTVGRNQCVPPGVPNSCSVLQNVRSLPALRKRRASRPRSLAFEAM